MRARLCFVLAALAAACVSPPASGQQLEATPPPFGPRPLGYLNGDEIQFRQVFPPPPAQGSLADDQDVAEVNRLQDETTPERFALAQQDALFLYPRFSDALGIPLDREHTPHLIALLNRAVADVEIPTRAGKDTFLRMRPFQRLQLKHVCRDDALIPPPPEERSSYPSGHAAVGWTTAYVLARVAPDRATPILARADDYALSRVICAAHWPSDVAASRAAAAAVLARLDTDPAFEHDLTCARAEYEARVGGNAGEPAVCRAAPHRAGGKRRR
jgi:acid phosphatase (class A)